MTTNKDGSEIELVSKFTEIELISLVDQGIEELDNNPLVVLEFLEEFDIEKE